MDETSFASKKNSKAVVAARGPRNVWASEVTANVHLAIVACGCTSGMVIPPVFILPGKMVKLDVLELCTVPGAAVIVTELGFVKAEVLRYLAATWPRCFEGSVPRDTPRPLLLIMDGCSAHYSLKVCDTAQEQQLLLVSLPSNAIHLFQPLDLAVFGSFKA
ncbi:hypothetical protein PC116_g1948 [Phytophthora cactorum]|uniref:DDE-1 domain-containing protein n=1 Tax=Phytophthora cactorum TaxID=29920 RepID=A0A329SQI5_9STRA|nr:hypothetical protein Pcac1_g24663 [Phytophthora cactorum]KAG2932605.1 hypothetical protein PC114_g1795 [Phytophthora cactorum]KAG2949712.1 hypothetical protein PC117_g5012 [Phytophthora cactorum]KAG3038760.1 hypothetical protein PC119_g2664 [Phytophthora cactorum]KAG3184054.1 hypothetical protein C6341_g5169 [Phytophthora cactorum]